MAPKTSRNNPFQQPRPSSATSPSLPSAIANHQDENTPHSTPTNAKIVGQARPAAVFEQEKLKLAEDAAKRAEQHADLAVAAAKDKKLIAELQKQVAVLTAEREAARAELSDLRKANAKLVKKAEDVKVAHKTEVDELKQMAAALQADLDHEKARADELAEQLKQVTMSEEWQDPAEYVIKYRPEMSHTEASAWVRDRLAELGIDWSNYQEFPGWGKKSESKYSKWVAQEQALRRDLLPALGG
ncbi:hypothetical protein BCR44DRAFT_399422, partial [Catenaria anguillulae PL171]